MKLGHSHSRKNKKIPIDTAVYIKDSLCLSDQAYRCLYRNLSKLPSLKSIKKRCKEIDSNFNIGRYENMIGAWESLQDKILHIVKIMQAKYPDDPLPDDIGVKLSGDGTWIGKRIHVVNLTLRIIYGKHHSEEYILGMVRAPEKYDSLKEVVTLLWDLSGEVTCMGGQMTSNEDSNLSNYRLCVFTLNLILRGIN